MIMVTGGAGFIGSHVVKELIFSGRDVVVLDNLSTGHRETVQAVSEMTAGEEKAGKLKFIKGDTGDLELVRSIILDYDVEALIHLAAFSQVSQSMKDPGRYFENNTARMITILERMAECNVKKIVFSSTAAVYGEPDQIPITEDHPLQPTNVYGVSKLMVEQMLHWYDQIYGIKYAALRYFNAAGADASGEIGEWHQPETHLIPLVIQKVLGEQKELVIFGDDYPTPDGTCIRDYIHVSDLARAHILALQAIEDGAPSRIYNLGNGKGFSVKEVINTVAAVTGKKVEYNIGPRRPGDPAVLVSSSQKIQEQLGWKPQYPALEDMVASAWKWHKNRV